MNQIRANISNRLTAAAIAAAVVLSSAAAHAAGGHDFVLPLGPKHPSGLTLHVDGRGIDATGYRPVRVTVATWPPNKPLTADRQVRLVLDFHGYGGRKSQISQVIELPEGSASVTATVLVPQLGPFNSISIDTFEGGEKLKDLSSDSLGWPNTSGGNWTEARPALLFIDLHAPPRGERLAVVKAFEANASDASPTHALPDVRQLLSLLPDLDNSRVPRVPPTASIPSTTSQISDTALLTILAARSRAEMIPPAELPERWIEISQYDVATISLADLKSMAFNHPRQLAALLGWLSTGPLLIVYGAGQNYAHLPEIENLLKLPAFAPDPTLSSLRGWTPPLLGSSTANVTAIFSDTGEAVPIAPFASPPTTARSAPEATNPNRPTWPLPVVPPFVSRPSGTGCVVAIASDNPFPGVRSDWDWILADVSQSHWQSFKRTGFSQQRTNPDYWKLLIPGVGEAPVISYLLLVSLFAVVIGPINYLLLDRARRLYLLLVTVPAGAVLVTTSLFAFAVVSDGLTMRLRIRSIADLDQRTGRA
ncbi:MAG TPA: hypothetical protein VKH44_03580, partial [Pirellulaceae bacterium]|nr:hypothetical protein [Pirellulaceae bacterium]